MALYDHAAYYDYGELQSEMIQDRFVVGIPNSALLEFVQPYMELTLEKAKKQIRQHEAVQEQQQVLKKE